MKKKIVIFINDYDYFISHKYDALKLFDKEKYLFKIFSTKKKNKIFNFEFCRLFIDPIGKNPFKECLTFLHMFLIILKNKNCIFHYYTLKPILYGALIGKILNIRNNVFIFSGLGNILLGAKKDFIKKIILNLLKLSLSKKKYNFIFQNKDDYKFLKKNDILKSRKNYFTLGSGLNFKKLPKIKKKSGKILNVVLLGRMKHHKGILDFIKIAKNFKESSYKINFYLIGSTKKSNDYLQLSFLKKLNKKNSNIKWLGFIKSKKKIYELSDIVFILSHHGEGVPRVVLESTFYGKTIISNNIPGCKDLIHKNINGYLINIHDTDSACSLIKMLYTKRQLLKKNLKVSKNFALNNFGIEKVQKVYKKIYEQFKT